MRTDLACLGEVIMLNGTPVYEGMTFHHIICDDGGYGGKPA